MSEQAQNQDENKLIAERRGKLAQIHVKTVPQMAFPIISAGNFMRLIYKRAR